MTPLVTDASPSAVSQSEIHLLESARRRFAKTLMKTCPICQQAYSDEVEFCAREGARLSGEVRDERECPFCAERILKKARVCKHCGRDVEPMVGSDVSVLPAPPPVAEKQPELPIAAPSASEPVTRPSRPPVPAKPPQFEMIAAQPSKLKYVVLAVVAVVLVVGGIWYVIQHRVKKGEVRVNPTDGLKYVWVPSGAFLMGCSAGDAECYDFEKPSHGVGISKGFWLGQTVVTVDAYKRFTAATGKSMPPEPDLKGRALNPGWNDAAMPMVEVTWSDANAYCAWAGGRLPTEAEWEYAARAGSTAARYDDLDGSAWYADNSGRDHLDSMTIWKKEDQASFTKLLNDNGNSLHAVGQKHPNDFGLYDMLGNVWEWVGDWWDPRYYLTSPALDPTGPTSGTERLLRGGAWDGSHRDMRVSLRNRRNPGDRDIDLGFRCGGDMDLP
jgi:formylglycine-generating enzyme required for sulfatase activity